MKARPIGTLAVLATVLLVVIASTAGGTAARFGDDERVNVTFASGSGDEGTFRIATVDEPELTVELQNGRSAERWEDGISYGPPDYRTGVLVITSQDDLKLEVTSDSPEELVFEIEAELIARALEVDDLRGVTATLDGRPLEYELVYLSGADHVVFRIEDFSTRYVVFAETVVVPDEPLPADNSSGNETTAAPVSEDPVDDGPPAVPPGKSGDAPGQNGKDSDTDGTVSDDPVTTTSTPGPVTTDDSTPEPVTTDDSTPEPVTTDDATPEPVSTPEPVTTDEPTPEPVTTDEPTPEPVTTDEPTPEPVTTDGSTPEPVTTDDSTPEPVTTDGGATVADG